MLLKLLITAGYLFSLSQAFLTPSQMSALSQLFRGSGMSGVPGMSGIPGMSGTTGLPGMSKIPGMTGMSGMSGIPKTSGMSGMTGMTGMSGKSGVPGKTPTPTAAASTFTKTYGTFTMRYSKQNTLKQVCDMAVGMMHGRVSDHLSDVMGDAVAFLKGYAPNQLISRADPIGQKWNCLLNDVTNGGLNPGNAANGMADYFDTAAEKPMFTAVGSPFSPCDMVFCGEGAMTPTNILIQVMGRLQRGRPLGRFSRFFGTGRIPHHFSAGKIGNFLPRGTALRGMGLRGMTHGNSMAQPATANNNMAQPGIPNNNMAQPGIPNNNMAQPATPNNNMGQPATSTGQAGNSNNMAQASTPNNNMGQPSTPNNNMGQPSTPNNSMAQPATTNNNMGQPATPNNNMGQPSTPNNNMGQPATPNNSMAQPATTTNNMGQAATPNNNMGQSGANIMAASAGQNAPSSSSFSPSSSSSGTMGLGGWLGGGMNMDPLLGTFLQPTSSAQSSGGVFGKLNTGRLLQVMQTMRALESLQDPPEHQPRRSPLSPTLNFPFNLGGSAPNLAQGGNGAQGITFPFNLGGFATNGAQGGTGAGNGGVAGDMATMLRMFG